MRQLVVLSAAEPNDRGLSPIGTRAEIERKLLHLNTGADGSGDETLYGPGIEIQLASNQDPVVQMLMMVSDEDIAWLVVERMGRTLQWKFVDINTGSELAFTDA